MGGVTSPLSDVTSGSGGWVGAEPNQKSKIEKEIRSLENKLAVLHKNILNYEAKLRQTKRLPSWDKRIKTDPNPVAIWDQDATNAHFDLDSFV